MNGQIVHQGDHLCGLMPTAVKAGAVWECACGQQWVRVPPRAGYLSWSGCWIPPEGWRWETRTPVAAVVTSPEHGFCGLDRADPVHMFWLGLGLGCGATLLGLIIAVTLWTVQSAP